jgi:hypothetical protein
MDCAIAKAHQKIIKATESMTSWKVSQDALLILKVDSWGSLGFKMQAVPNLLATKEKVMREHHI